MVTQLDPVDIVTVGVGWAGSIVAKELAQDGKQVVGLERGGEITTDDYLSVHDELRYATHHELYQDLSKQTFTERLSPEDEALPMRKYGIPLGTDTGGAGNHWTGQTWRYHPYDFEIRSRTIDRYGEDKIPDWMPIQDWGITYEELEPYYTQFDKLIGTSGNAGNLKGETQDKGNPFEGPRSEEYPTGPMKSSPLTERFRKAAKNLGYHPFSQPSATLSEGYTNPDGVKRDACQYCGFCTSYGCEWGAKASPIVTTIPVAKATGNFEMRTHSDVKKVLYDSQKGQATGVQYIDRESGEMYEQPADVVVLSAYSVHNVRLLLLSEIGKPYDPETGEGVVGKNYCYHQFSGAVTGFFDDEKWNLYMGAGGLGEVIDDFNADAFDHSDVDFIHGATPEVYQSGTTPIANNPTPSDTPSWGSEFKRQSLKYNYSAISFLLQGATLPHKENYLSLDPTYTDADGTPLLRITYNWTENDKKIAEFITKKGEKIMKEMGASEISSVDNPVPSTANGNFTHVGAGEAHQIGGAIMGANPDTSVVNTYLQHWDADNLFVVGGSAFAHQSAHNPTGTIGALSFRAADGIKQYFNKGGMLETGQSTPKQTGSTNQSGGNGKAKAGSDD